mgnify:FL=1
MSKDYYIRNGIQVFDIVEAFGLNFNLGNVVKYVCRAGKKDDCIVSDLRKARDYIDREIAFLLGKSVSAVPAKTQAPPADDLKGLAAREAFL